MNGLTMHTLKVSFYLFICLSIRLTTLGRPLFWSPLFDCHFMSTLSVSISSPQVSLYVGLFDCLTLKFPSSIISGRAGVRLITNLVQTGSTSFNWWYPTNIAYFGISNQKWWRCKIIVKVGDITFNMILLARLWSKEYNKWLDWRRASIRES